MLIYNSDIFAENESAFSTLFERILTLSTSQELPLSTKSYLISFVDAAFQSLELIHLRQQCAPLVSIAIWHSLSSSRDALLTENPTLKKSWKSVNKRFDAADDQKKIRMRIDRSWIFSICIELLVKLYVKGADKDEQVVKYTERVLELLINILSQLPTRKFTNSLLKDMNFAVAVKLSAVYTSERNWMIRQFLEMLEYYINFPVNDFSGVEFSEDQVMAAKARDVLILQKIALDHFKDKLLVLALSNYGSVSTRASLLESLGSLTDFELQSLCEYLGMPIKYSIEGIPIGRQFYIELLINRFVKRPSLLQLNESLSLMPTEKALCSPIFNKIATGASPLPIPRLNLQFLSSSDFSRRALELARLESFYDIKTDIEAIVRRLKLATSGIFKANGTSRLAQRISRPTILTVAEPLVGEINPAFVRAELYLEFDKVADDVLKDWDTIKSGDMLFLVGLTIPNSKSANEFQKIGIKHVRAAEVVDVLDQNSRSLKSITENENDKTDDRNHSRRKPLYGKLAKRRRIHVNLDASSYANDSEKVYASLNFVFRRRPHEKNFKPILSTARNLAGTQDLLLPEWLVDVFMGYGDPEAASFESIVASNDSVDMGDTFVNWAHLNDSFEEAVVATEAMGDLEGALPPYVIKRATRVVDIRPKKGRGRKKVEEDSGEKEENVLEVSTYHLPSLGPYAIDARKRNMITYTRAQVQAIYSGTQRGLTMVVGPPGTGKTDVAAQIVSNVYHNQPLQRTLVISKSEKALDRFFERIAALDVDERHLLRLGSKDSYSRYGRVESLLERRRQLLERVAKLADSVGAQGSPGESCEAAGYFYRVFVQSIWHKFKNQEYTDVATLSSNFPFSGYFSDAPQPLFNSELHSIEEALEVADGCFRHLERIFNEIDDIRPFELLKKEKDRANYLLIREARVVALTAAEAIIRVSVFFFFFFHFQFPKIAY